MKFTDLGLSEVLLNILSDIGYEKPTPIQEQSIPIVLKGIDLLGCAQTGTGKTAAFSLPIVENLLQQEKTKGIKALILCPTRELAIQIEENIKSYTKGTELRHAVIFGGVKQHSQVAQLKQGVDILVATPGRLLDLYNQKLLKLNQVKYWVLDEADRMLDMGFIHDIKKLMQVIPKERQTLFFSATMPLNIAALAKEILKPNAQKVEVARVSSTAEKVFQKVYRTNKGDKKNLLLHILENPDITQTIVFSRTKHGADKIAKILEKEKIKVAALHGDKSQNQRQKALQMFKDKKIRVLVATDIAARGIDVEKLKYVINFDLPNESESYVHRIGRAGRAGEEGHAISMCEPEELVYLKDIEKLIKTKIKEVHNHPYPMTDLPLTKEEKRLVEIEKERKKREFFENKRKKQGKGGSKKTANGGARAPKKPGGKSFSKGGSKPGGRTGGPSKNKSRR